jgi:hypothetical protein
MKVKFIKQVRFYTNDRFNVYEYEALEDGTITTSCGDHPTFGIKELRDMRLWIRKGETFQLKGEYLEKNNLEILSQEQKREGSETLGDTSGSEQKSVKCVNSTIAKAPEPSITNENQEETVKEK